MLNVRAEDVRSSSARRTASPSARQPKVGPTAYMLRGGAVVGGTIDAERAGESIKALRDEPRRAPQGRALRRGLRARAPQASSSDLLSESTVTASSLRGSADRDLTVSTPTTTTRCSSRCRRVAGAGPRLIARANPANEVMVMLGDKDHINKTFAKPASRTSRWSSRTTSSVGSFAHRSDHADRWVSRVLQTPGGAAG